MKVYNASLLRNTHGFNDIQDLTEDVTEIVNSSGVTNGNITVFIPGSTVGVTTIEFETGAIEDFKKALERIAPQDIYYSHNARWGDGNGFSHVRSALLKPSLTIPIINGTIQLGTWQQIVIVDFDNRPREREIIVQIIGE